MTSSTLLTSTEAKVYARYANGQTSEQITAASGIAHDHVKRILSSIGWDPHKAASLAQEHARHNGVTLNARPAPPTVTVTNPAAVMPRPQPAPDTIAELLTVADHSPNKRTQALAGKIRALVDELRAKVDAEEAEAEAQREVEKARAELEAALAKLAAARGTAPAVVRRESQSADGPTSKELRSWAKANGVDCPKLGRVPASVRAAYEAAGGSA